MKLPGETIAEVVHDMRSHGNGGLSALDGYATRVEDAFAAEAEYRKALEFALFTINDTANAQTLDANFRCGLIAATACAAICQPSAKKKRNRQGLATDEPTQPTT